MSTLYRNLYEYSRVVETVTLTEEGTYVKDRTPDDYGGSMMNVEVVQRITMIDAAGYLDIYYFENPVPISKNRQTQSGYIYLGDETILVGYAGSDDRIWTLRKNDNLPQVLKTLGDKYVALAKADKDLNAGLVL